MFKNNKKVVPIRASPSPSPSGSGSFYQGLPRVALRNHDAGGGADHEEETGDHDEFERQMNIEMDLFGEDMHTGAEPVAARMVAVEEGPGGREGKEEEQEEVLLAHDLPGAGAKSTEALRKAFKAMQVQIAEFQKRTDKAQEERRELQKKVFELEDKVDMLEDENQTLNQQVQAGGGGLKVIGGGAGPKGFKGNNAGDKLRQELKQSGDIDDMELGLTDTEKNQSLKARFLAWAAKKKPFQKDIRTIQAKFGSAVASYFVFCRFIFLQICLIAVVALIFVILHLFLLSKTGRSFKSLMSGSGMLPGFMLFSAFSAEEAFQYSLFILFGVLVFFVSIIEHLIVEDKTMKIIDAQEEGNEAPYSKAIFCAWDFSGAGYFPSLRQVDEQMGSLANTYVQMLEETRTAGLMKSRSRFELLVLYMRRLAALILYLAVQASSFGAIIFLTVNTEAITIWLSTTPFANFASILAPLVLNFVNSISPPLLKEITNMEKWDSGQMQVNILLARMYLSNILNTLILGLSYLMLADPFLFSQYVTLRASLQLPESGGFDCRLDQAADAMFSLIVTNFFIGNIFMIGMGYAYKSIYWLFSNYIGDFEPFPFEVEPAMINLFNTMSLVMITFPFAPQAMVFLPMAIYINVKVEVFCMKEFNGKPERTWKSHQSGVIFTSFYAVTLCLIGIPTAIMFLSAGTFPKNCAIQDSFIGLCASALDSDNTCVQDAGNQFHDFYKDKAYPKDFCTKSCGPFVAYESSLEAIKEVAFTFSAIKTTWQLLFDGAYVAWTVVIILVVIRYRANNTKNTLSESEAAKERGFTVQIESLEAERKKQEKLITRMKAQAQAEDEAAAMRSPR